MAVPLYAVEDNCADRRYPALVGDWVVACGKGGQIDRLMHLPDGDIVALPAPLDPRKTGVGPGPASGSAALVQVGGAVRLYIVDEDGVHQVESPTRLPGLPAGLPATDGVHVAAVMDGRVEALVATDKVRPSWTAKPVGWQAVALNWPWVAWVQQGPDGSEDVWALQVGGASPAPIAQGPSHQRLVVADGDGFVFAEGERLARWRPDRGITERLDTHTGFLSAPTSSEGQLCWEERRDDADDIDVICTDAMAAKGPGDQLRPSRSGAWLIYRHEGRVWLRTAP